MKIILISAFVLFTSFSGVPQNIDFNSRIFQKKNSLNIEVGGYTVIGAVYFERLIVNKPKFKTVAQIGYGVVGWPVGFHGLVSSNKNHFEFGACITFPSNLIFDSGASNPYITGRLGYRFQKPDGNFIFRAGLMPVIVGADKEYGPEMILWVWPGISFGLAF
jgi:hypothetical protein